MTSWSRRVSVATARPSVSNARSRSGERDALLAEAVAHGVVDTDLAALAAMVDAAVAHPGLATTVVVHGELEGVVAELAFEVLHSANGAEVRLLDGPVLAPGRRVVAQLGVAEADDLEGLVEGLVELDGEAVRNILSDTLVETPDMVAVFASVGREALWANDAFVTLIPIRESDKIWLVELLDEWSRGHYEVKVLPALVKFGRWRGRLTFVSDAGPLPVSAVMVAHRDQSGDIVQVALVARDLSELRAAEERVNATETRFAALVEQVSDLIVVVDPDGTIRYLSPAVSRTLGHDEGHLEGTNVLDLVHPEDRPTDLPTLAQPDRPGHRVAGGVAGGGQRRLVAPPRGHRHRSHPEPGHRRRGAQRSRRDRTGDGRPRAGQPRLHRSPDRPTQPGAVAGPARIAHGDRSGDRRRGGPRG